MADRAVIDTFSVCLHLQPVENTLRSPHVDRESIPPQSPDQWQVRFCLFGPVHESNHDFPFAEKRFLVHYL